MISIRQASMNDAKLLTDLSYTTFWDAFAHHPKNAPDDLNHYMPPVRTPRSVIDHYRQLLALYQVSQTRFLSG